MEYWESKFTEEQTLWGFLPSESAIITKDYFIGKQVNRILIPGIGYGRNARIFYENGFNVTGIEISKTAIELAKSESKLEILIHHGSVTEMPFDDQKYDGIFCYALIHLLNSNERKVFVESCYNQLRVGGYMVFTVVSKKADMFGNGKFLSTDRYELMKGLSVFFYDNESVEKEFKNYGLVEYFDIDEPIKHMDGYPPLKCIMVRCQKKD